MLDYFISLATLTGWVLKIYSWVHIATFVLSWIQADPNNHLVSIINRSTLPMWNWVGKKLPRNVAAFAPIVALMLVIFGEITVPGAIRSIGATLDGNIELNDGLLNIVFYVLYGGLYIISNLIGFIFFLAILWFIFTLVNPPLDHPIIRSVLFLVDPLISPLQKILPRAKIDLSPLVLALIAFFLRDALSKVILPIQANLMI